MKTPSKAGWYVARGGFLEKGGKPFAGPFSSREDAMIAREALERELPNHSLWISEWTTPTVELPTEPTLGWLENVYGARILKHWFRGEGVAEAFDGDRWNFTKEVIAFTPAVAVPKAALDELQANHDCSGPLSCLRGHVDDFLAAVDEANA